MELKVSKEEAAYKFPIAPDASERCGNCVMFHHWLSACDKVRGYISRDAVCKFWEPK